MLRLSAARRMLWKSERLADVSLSRWYRCISRCVRRAKLLAEERNDGTNRKARIENRWQELAKIFAIAVGGFSVLDNHLHLQLRVDDQVGQQWSDEEVVRRWLTLYPPRASNRKLLPVTDEMVQAKIADAHWVVTTRERLCSLSWLMKCLKESLSRLVNKAEKCTGASFEGRYKSIAILDKESLLSVKATRRGHCIFLTSANRP